MGNRRSRPAGVEAGDVGQAETDHASAEQHEEGVAKEVQPGKEAAAKEAAKEVQPGTKAAAEDAAGARPLSLGVVADATAPKPRFAAMHKGSASSSGVDLNFKISSSTADLQAAKPLTAARSRLKSVQSRMELVEVRPTWGWCGAGRSPCSPPSPVRCALRGGAEGPTQMLLRYLAGRRNTICARWRRQRSNANRPRTGTQSTGQSAWCRPTAAATCSIWSASPASPRPPSFRCGEL
jgi:hypothetical protein